jgi:ABC-type oligopeptide transport system ATPase subunit
VAIARALAAEPKILLCDEILSALDVSVQAEIIDLLRSLQKDLGISILFISHDLAVVRWLANRVAVLYQGELCEIGTVTEIYAPPFHPYTKALLDAVPEIGKRSAKAR